MKKYFIKIILVKKLVLFLILSIIVTNSLAILTYTYIAKTVLPGIIFLLSIILCYFVGKKILYKNVEIIIASDAIYYNSKQYLYSDLKSYTFDSTDYLHKANLCFLDKSIKLYVLNKHSHNYLALKKEIEEQIRFINRNSTNKIVEYNWYKTSFAKIYGYVMIFIFILWIMVMLLYPEKFKLSNFGLFLMLLAGIVPIIIKIFKKN